MLCERCHENQATTYLKQTVNGVSRELHLCTSCAMQYGFSSPFSLADTFFGNLLGVNDIHGKNVCPSCGTRFSEISESGNVGCAECYAFFADELSPTISRIHSNSVHKGKRPIKKEDTKNGTQLKSEEASDSHKDEKTDVKASSAEKKLKNLKKQQSDAIKDENFELAAKLRDEIKALEKKADGGNGND